MPTNVDELRAVMRMELKPFMRDLQKMHGVNGQAARKVEATWMATNRRLDGIGRNMVRSLVAPMAGLGAVLGGAELIRLTDTWTDLTSRVNLAAGSMEAGTEVMGRLGEMARRTYSSLEQTTESYIGNARALQELGYNTDQQLDYTEALNNALVISAARGDRAAAIQNALTKAMAGGKLAGDDLNTVIQQGGRVAQALAEGLGVGVNQLRALGAAGKITSRDVFRALTSQMVTLRREAEQMPATISDGVQLLRNALLEYVGNGDQAVGVSAKISEALVIMADNFNTTADVALQLAAVIAGALVGRSLAGMIAKLGLAGAALINFTRALSAARTMAGLSMAFSGLGAAAGPVGLLIGGAVVSSLVMYSNATAEATAATRTYEEALEAVRAQATETSDAVEESARKIDAKTENMLARGVETGVNDVGRLRSEIAALMEQYDLLTVRRVIAPEQLAQIDEFREKFASGSEDVKSLENRLFALANSSPDMQPLAERLSPLLTALREAIAATDLLQTKLAAPDKAVSQAYQQYGASRVAGNAIQAEREEYEKNAIRRAQLGKAQLDLENEIARVRQQAEKDNIQLTEDQIKRIAEANLAGNASRSGEGKKPAKERADEYERLAQRIADSTAAMVAETEVQRQLNPLIDDYGYAIERARAEQELLNAAKKAGIEVTPKLRQEIQGLAHQYATASAEAARLSEEQNKARQKAEEWVGLQRDVTQGLIDDLVKGKSAAEAFANALQKVADKLLNEVLDAIFDVKNAGSGGGIFGFLGSLLGLGGGLRLPGTAPIPTPAPRAAGGPVRKGQPYIVGEKRAELFVPDQNGTILPSVPQMPSIASAGTAAPQITYAPVYNVAQGADPRAIAELRTAQARDRAEFGAKVLDTVRKANKGRHKFV